MTTNTIALIDILKTTAAKMEASHPDLYAEWVDLGAVGQSDPANAELKRRFVNVFMSIADEHIRNS